MILPRLLSIALRRYCAEPETRKASARMLATNGLRVAVLELGREEAARLALGVLEERRAASEAA